MAYEKSPAEIFSDASKEKVFAVEALWYREEGKENDENSLSRLKWTIIHFGDDKNVVSGNIKEADISSLWRQVQTIPTQLAMQKMLSAAMNNNSKDAVDTSVADQVISMGSLKGQTYRQILLDGKKGDLIKQIDFLQSNLKKYPANQKQIDSIKKSIDLFEKGLLETTSPSVKSALYVELINTPIKTIGKADKDGYQTFYSIKVVFDGSREKPWVIEIVNLRGTVKTEGNLKMLDKVVLKSSEVFYYEFATGYSRFERMYQSYQAFMMKTDAKIQKNVAEWSNKFHSKT